MLSRDNPLHHHSGTPEPLSVPEAGQWLVTTPSRLAGDGYSWLQAVHWVAESDCYRPARRHGPRFGATTVRLARALSALSPCRPGIAYLARELKLSERSVKYHLGMLREAGLLAYVVRGSRAPGRVALASEFALVIPPQFDAAVGLRTVGEGVLRRPCGIADDGRHLMSVLGRLAAAAPRAATGRRRRSGGGRRCSAGSVNSAGGSGRCTPMENGSRLSSPTVATCLPPDEPTAARDTRPGRVRTAHAQEGRTGPACPRPNPLARRFRLAGELIEQVPWLGRAALPRVAWVAREVADAGWHVTEVVAWLGLSAPPDRVRRPSAFLAHRLKGAHLIAVTPAQRASLVEEWRDRRAGPAASRKEWQGCWEQPADPGVRTAVARAMAACTAPKAPADGAIGIEAADDRMASDGPGPSRDEIAHLRVAALHDPSLVRAALDTWGADVAARIYTPRLVDLVRRAQDRAHGGTGLRLHAVNDDPGGRTARWGISPITGNEVMEGSPNGSHTGAVARSLA